MRAENRVPPVMEEHFPKLQEKLEPDSMALAMVATHRPIKVTPEREEYVFISREDELYLDECLEKAEADNYKKCYLVIHSPGGTVLSSYKIARRIRRQFERIIVFVPHMALSGGTLVALTGNEIVMGEMSNLTPIDIQRFYKGEYRSVNAMIRAFNILNNYFSSHSKDEATYAWIALLEKLDPVILQDWTDSKSLMEIYAKEILSYEHAEFSEVEAECIVSKLLETYPSHDYALMREELDEIIRECTGKQVVKKPSDYPDLWKLMVKWQREYAEVEATSHIFRYVVPKKEEEV